MSETDVCAGYIGAIVGVAEDLSPVGGHCTGAIVAIACCDEAPDAPDPEDEPMVPEPGESVSYYETNEGESFGHAPPEETPVDLLPAGPDFEYGQSDDTEISSGTYLTQEANGPGGLDFNPMTGSTGDGDVVPF